MLTAGTTQPSTLRDPSDTGAKTQWPASRNFKHRAKRVIVLSSDSEEEDKEVSVSFLLFQFLQHRYDLSSCEVALTLRTSTSDDRRSKCSRTDKELDKIL